ERRHRRTPNGPYHPGSFGRCALSPISPLSWHRHMSRRRAMQTQQPSAAIDEARLNAFVGRMLGDMGATISAALVAVGDRLGLYKAMAEAGPMDPAGLARRTGTAERYVREWLAAQ